MNEIRPDGVEDSQFVVVTDNQEDLSSDELNNLSISTESSDDLDDFNQFKIDLSTKNQILKKACLKVFKKCYENNEIKNKETNNHLKELLILLITGLYKQWEKNPQSYLSISLNANNWSGKGDYASLNVSYARANNLIIRLIERQFIETVKGDRSHNPENRRETRIRARKELIEEIIKGNITDSNKLETLKLDPKRFISINKKKEYIRLKNDKKILIELPLILPADVKKSIKTLKAYERLLIDTHIEYGDGCVLSEYDKNIYRVFSNSSFEQNGRIHASWQSIKSILRRDILINGLKTIELDIKSTFPALIYHVVGIDAWNESQATNQEKFHVPDLYSLDGYTDHPKYGAIYRKVFKKAFNMAINSKGRDNLGWMVAQINPELKYWGNQSKLDVNEVSKDLSKCIKLFLYERHSRIKDYLFDPFVGLKAMNIESNIAIKIIDRMTRNNIPILAIHDGFLTLEAERVELHETIINSYYTELGFTPYVESK